MAYESWGVNSKFQNWESGGKREEISKLLVVKKDYTFKLTSKKCRNLSLSVRVAWFGLVQSVSNFTYRGSHMVFPESIF